MMRNDPIKHVFIWPAVLVVLAISIFPLIYSLTTSFLSYRLVPPIPPRVVWFGNYADAPAGAALLECDLHDDADRVHRRRRCNT